MVLLLLALATLAHHQIRSVGAAGQLSVRLLRLLFLQHLSVVLLQATEDLLLVHLATVTTANDQRQLARKQQIPLKVVECCPHHQGELGKQQ